MAGGGCGIFALGEIRRNHSIGSKVRDAVADLVCGAINWPQWFTLANYDILLRFRRSVLGPFWVSLSFGITVVALSAVYERILNQDPRLYLPYLTAGLIVWSFISVTLQEGCEAFILEAGVLWQTYMPRSTFIYRVIWRNTVIFAFNMIVFAAAAAWCALTPNWRILLALPGFLLLYLNITWTVLLLAIICTRFRDISRLVANLLQLSLLITPVIWHAGSFPQLQTLENWNPLYHGIELVRAPLLGTAPTAATWFGALLAAGAGWFLTLGLFVHARWRITYWL